MIEIAPQISHKGFFPLHKDGRCFIKIPKVGSTTANQVLKAGLGWEVCEGKMVDPDWECVALVRHPVDRWISGMSQWAQGASAQRVPLEESLEKMVFDVHTQPQAWWLEGVAPSLFKLESIQKLWAYLDVTTKVHNNKKDGRKHIFALDKGHEEKIKSYYADDLRLWEIAHG